MSGTLFFDGHCGMCEVYCGAEAANAAVLAALGTRLPLLIYRIPGIRGLEDAIYRWVADHRYRFPGTTPYCESHPVAGRVLSPRPA